MDEPVTRKYGHSSCSKIEAAGSVCKGTAMQSSLADVAVSFYSLQDDLEELSERCVAFGNTDLLTLVTDLATEARLYQWRLAQMFADMDGKRLSELIHALPRYPSALRTIASGETAPGEVFEPAPRLLGIWEQLKSRCS